MSSARRKPFLAYGVFSPEGRLETTRQRQDLAVEAARIIGGTDWEHHGFTVEPVSVERGGATTITPSESSA